MWRWALGGVGVGEGGGSGGAGVVVCARRTGVWWGEKCCTERLNLPTLSTPRGQYEETHTLVVIVHIRGDYIPKEMTNT